MTQPQARVPVGANPGGVDVSCDPAAAPGVSPLLRLSTLQYRNTVRDLLAAVGASALLPAIADQLGSIPDDSLADGFRGRDNRTALEHVQGYFDVGRKVGDALTADPALLTTVAGACAGEATLSPSCVDGFLDRFVQLAYRRPLSPAERADFASLNDGTRSPAQAIRALIVVALSSPRFVHHVEVDGSALSSADDVLQLSAYEIASRLSYTFWQTMPDAELLRAAEDGSLASDDGFAAQLERVFEDPRTQQTLWSFWNEWFRFEKFTGFESTRPALQALAQGESLGVKGHDHYADMVQEVQDLTSLFTFQKNATLSDLLTTDLSLTKSADLAHLYGVSAWSGQGEYPRLPPTRVGLLQRAALLVSNLEQTNPFHRGAFLRRTLLCDPLPQPDPNSLPPGSLDPPKPSSAQTTRQRFQAKVEGNVLCQGCHGSFSDIGYALESFDALGRFRSVEQVFDEKNRRQARRASHRHQRRAQDHARRLEPGGGCGRAQSTPGCEPKGRSLPSPALLRICRTASGKRRHLGRVRGAGSGSGLERSSARPGRRIPALGPIFELFFSERWDRNDGSDPRRRIAATLFARHGRSAARAAILAIAAAQGGGSAGDDFSQASDRLQELQHAADQAVVSGLHRQRLSAEEFEIQ